MNKLAHGCDILLDNIQNKPTGCDILLVKSTEQTNWLWYLEGITANVHPVWDSLFIALHDLLHWLYVANLLLLQNLYFNSDGNDIKDKLEKKYFSMANS